MSASEIVRQLSMQPTLAGSENLTAEDCEKALFTLQQEFDPTYGGFGRAPKFPPSMVLEALLRDGGEPAMLMAGQTLEAMARGGIYDQIGGGFARYSVDAGWVVPHFEKMLYDNALLLGAYTHWWRRSRDPLAERVVTETVAWLLAEMRTEQGAFAASLDADSKDDHGELREGAYYVWDRDQLQAALGNQDATWAAETFAVTATGTFEHGASTLQLQSDHDQLRFADVRERLRIARNQRSRPGRDDKVVAAWNGWLIDALAEAAMIFGRPDWLAVATEAAEYLWQIHWRNGRLRRTSRDGLVGAAAGILEDYAACALAAVRLAAVHAAPTWLSRAEQLLEVIMEQFDDAGRGFFDTAADAERLYARPQDPTDNATPSGLSTTVHALRAMAELTGEERYSARADRAAASAAELVRQAPRFAGWLLADAISQTPTPKPVQVAVVGRDDQARAELALVAHQLAPAGSVVLAGAPDQPGIALLADRPLIDDQRDRLRLSTVRLQAPGHVGSKTWPVSLQTTNCCKQLRSQADHRDGYVVAHEAADGPDVKDLMEAEPAGRGVRTLSGIDHCAKGVADAAGHEQDQHRQPGRVIENVKPPEGCPAHHEVEHGVEPPRR